MMLTAFPPPKQHVFEMRSLPLPPTAPSIEGKNSEEAMDQSLFEAQPIAVEVKKPRIPTIFVCRKGKLKALSFQSQMSSHFLKVTVANDIKYRVLNPWHIEAGVEFKSFMLKDRPVKVVI
ncbi:hypothetical protein TNCV_3759731 [Trichonephila clavipes]|nr:hypothetical protein TNCV_3759731 [Trichonephila clavipes]